MSYQKFHYCKGTKHLVLIADVFLFCKLSMMMHRDKFDMNNDTERREK